MCNHSLRVQPTIRAQGHSLAKEVLLNFRIALPLLAALTVSTPGIGFGQTQVDLRSQAKSPDFSRSSTATLPARIGTTLPPACSAGEQFVLSNGGNTYYPYICGTQSNWVEVRGDLPRAAGQPNGTLITTSGGAAVWRALGGDISGTPNDVVVQRIQGRAVGTAVPAAGDALRWNEGTSQWEPSSATVQLTAGLGVVLAGSTIALDDAMVSLYSTGDGMPTLPCKEGRDTHLDVQTGRMWICTATDTWRPLASASVRGNYNTLTAAVCDASNDGQIALPTDSVYDQLRCDGLGQWEHFSAGRRLSPPGTGWNWINQQGATTAQNNGVLQLSAPATGAPSARMMLRNLPAAPYTVTSRLHMMIAGPGSACGLVLYESATQRSLLFAVAMEDSTASPRLRVVYYSSPDTRTSSSLDVSTVLATQSHTWLRAQDDGNAMIFSGSADGLNWAEMYRETRTNRFATGPDQAGIACDAGTSSLPAGTSLSHWTVQ